LSIPSKIDSQDVSRDDHDRIALLFQLKLDHNSFHTTSQSTIRSLLRHRIASWDGEAGQDKLAGAYHPHSILLLSSPSFLNPIYSLNSILSIPSNEIKAAFHFIAFRFSVTRGQLAIATHHQHSLIHV